MSEQVKRFRADLCVQPIEVVAATDYDALHAEAAELRHRIEAADEWATGATQALEKKDAEIEALRAENGRLRETERALIHNHNLHVEKLEAARGLLRNASSAMAREGAESALVYEIDTFLTATPAPEVQAEQGERQEVVAHDALRERFSEIEDEVARGKHNAMSCFTAMRTAALYTPQPGPDVRGLVEALEQIARWDGFPPTGKFWEGSGEPMSYSACYGSNGERDHMRNVAAEALAAHRQAQQGGSHDT